MCCSLQYHARGLGDALKGTLLYFMKQTFKERPVQLDLGREVPGANDQHDLSDYVTREKEETTQETTINHTQSLVLYQKDRATRDETTISNIRTSRSWVPCPPSPCPCCRRTLQG